MKFMVTWTTTDQDKWLPILEMWAAMTPEERADVGDGVTLIGRWHATASRSGVLIAEATDASALFSYLGQWNSVMDLEVAPVVDDEESATIAKAILDAQR